MLPVEAIVPIAPLSRVVRDRVDEVDRQPASAIFALHLDRPRAGRHSTNFPSRG